MWPCSASETPTCRHTGLQTAVLFPDFTTHPASAPSRDSPTVLDENTGARSWCSHAGASRHFLHLQQPSPAMVRPLRPVSRNKSRNCRQASAQTAPGRGLRQCRRLVDQVDGNARMCKIAPGQGPVSPGLPPVGRIPAGMGIDDRNRDRLQRLSRPMMRVPRTTTTSGLRAASVTRQAMSFTEAISMTSQSGFGRAFRRGFSTI